jgi:RimJ/RimL family protein N-acetyltransferase
MFEVQTGHRFAADVHGHGYATELASKALRQAHAVDPARPVVASLLEHNIASERVAVKLGMKLMYRARDVGNPDLSAVRLVYADRPLSAAELSATIG